MLDKTQVTKIAVAGFGAAMASVYAIPEAHATVIPISFGSIAYGASGATTPVQFVYSSGSGPVQKILFTMAGLNTLNGKSLTGLSNYPMHLGLLTANQTQVSAGTFSTAHPNSYVAAPGNATGNAYIGFRTGNANMGWFEVNWGGTGGTIQFIRGYFSNAEGGSITVDRSTGVPEPSELGLFALGLLALGAAGVRMRREARKAAELN